MQSQAMVRSPHSSLLPVADGRGSYIHVLAVVCDDAKTTAIYVIFLGEGVLLVKISVKSGALLPLSKRRSMLRAWDRKDILLVILCYFDKF